MFKSSFLTALILTTAPVTVLAAEPNQAPRQAVFYGDLNLATEAGVRTLDRRIRRAIRQVCGSPDPVTVLTQRRCKAAAQASVIPRRSAAIAAARGGATGLAAVSR